MDLQSLLQQAEQVRLDPKRFSGYREKPIEFCAEVLGVKFAWSKQSDVLLAVRDHWKVAVRSGHGVGKTWVVACLILWWLYARQGIVVTTASTWDQVQNVLWKTIHRIKASAPVHLPGEFNNTDITISKEWFAIGLSTNMPNAFQGIHHPELLCVMDEAPGVNTQVHLEISTLTVDDTNRTIAIGNPTEPSGPFWEAFKNPEAWFPMELSCLDHPNVVSGKTIIPGAVTRKWVEEKRKEWGESHPLWFSRVLGQFPTLSNRGVIALRWIESQTNEEKRLEAIKEAEKASIPITAGLDVARYGENKSVLTVRRGDAVLLQELWPNMSLMETTGWAMKAIADHGISVLVVDASGIGAGVADRLLEQNAPVYAYNGGHRAFTPSSFNNRRTEVWWMLRERFEKGKIWLPVGLDRLTGELLSPTYELSSTGRIKIETKEALLKRNVPSPDHADSLTLAFATDENPEIDLEPPRAEHNQDEMAVEAGLDSPFPQVLQFRELPDGF